MISDFFAFYRLLEAYQDALQSNNTTAVLSPDSEFFRYFQTGAGAASHASLANTKREAQKALSEETRGSEELCILLVLTVSCDKFICADAREPMTKDHQRKTRRAIAAPANPTSAMPSV